MMGVKRTIFIDPSSEHFYENRLFDLENSFLNRDGTLLPFARLKEYFKKNGVEMHTADYLMRNERLGEVNEYWSLGILDRYAEISARDDVVLKGFLLLEPPLVAPRMYQNLPKISLAFEKVFIHNTVGDGYSLSGVNQDALHSFKWPQPYGAELEPYWGNTSRSKKLVVIAGHHHPRWRRPEYYSKRIEAVAELAKINAVDLYGRGWDKPWSKQSLWMTYLMNQRQLSKVYRGACASKMEVLSQYQFSLCFENTPMMGYVTEKIFDCFYAGTIPIYWGAKDIQNILPDDAFVEFSKYKNITDLYREIASWPEEKILRMKCAGKNFLRSQEGQAYYNSLITIFDSEELPRLVSPR